MKIILRQAVVAGLVLLTTAGASPLEELENGVDDPRLCGTPHDSEDIAREEEVFKSRLEALNARNPSRLENREEASATIDVWFHVISEDETYEKGNVPDSQLSDQVQILNEKYQAGGLSFNLAGISRTVNAEWFNPEGEIETAMKSALHTGGIQTLNVYTVGWTSGNNSGMLGFSTFPFSVGDTSDGVMIRFTSLPGGSQENYNLGYTLTHEVGHWVGLYHSFEGGCEGEGDFVDDTPAEASGAHGCPAQRNTCPGQEGEDPIHNFMDYTYDTCMTGFTEGQMARMQDQLETYRGITF